MKCLCSSNKKGGVTRFGMAVTLGMLLSLLSLNAQATRSSTYHHRADRWCAEQISGRHISAGLCVSVRRRQHCPRGFNSVRTFGGRVRGWQACIKTDQAAQARCAAIKGKHPELQCLVVAKTRQCPSGYHKDRVYAIQKTCTPGNHESARLACADFTRLHPGKPCRVVHRGRVCPRGFVGSKRYGGIARGYKSCIPGSKMGKVKQGLKKAGNKVLQVAPPLVPPFVPAPDPRTMVSGYKAYFLRVSRHANGKIPLPVEIIDRYQREYSNNLRNVRVSESSAVHGDNAMTDCRTIYFPAGSGMKNEVKNHTFSTLKHANWFFHELTHTEQCKKVGGRNNYAMKWFSHLAAGVIKAIVKGDRVNEKHIHDRMPMEAQANRKGSRIGAIYWRERPHP